jgi:Ser/Thr protein kinase RdoA (MazF antagonist)
MNDAATSEPARRPDLDRIGSGYARAARDALAHFPVQADAPQLVAYSENVSFRVATGDAGGDYVLRLHRPGYRSLAELESERIWTRALRRAGLPVPDSLRTRAGDDYALVDIPGARERRYAGMTTWQDGIPLGEYLRLHPDAGERRRIFRRFGAIAAALHDHACDWLPPPGFTRPRLGAEGLLGASPFWGRFWEHPALSATGQSRLIRTRDRLRGVLDDYGEDPRRFGLIHADFTLDNIVCNAGELGIIDFDDAAWGWHAWDLASILFDCRDAPDIDALQAALLAGYAEHRPLTTQDIDLLPVFVLVRGMAVIGWYLQRPEHPLAGECEEVIHWVLAEADRPAVP